MTRKKNIPAVSEKELASMLTEAIRSVASKQKRNDPRDLHRDPRTLDEDVMRRYWNIRHQSAPILLEKITVDRLMNKHGDNGFAIISANRTDKPDERNTHATKALIQDLKDSGFSYLPVYGGYKDTGRSGVVDKFEPSFVVFNYTQNGEPGNWDELHRFALDMCAKYEQSSVYIQAPGEAPEYQDEDGNKINSKSSRDYIKNDLDQEYFTSLSSPDEIASHGKTQKVGRRFTADIEFESKLYANPMPSSIAARRMRKGEVMVWD